MAANDPAPAPAADDMRLGRTRTGSAWVVTGLTLLLALLMLVFILQNGRRVRMTFLWMHFSLPLGVGMLLAMVLGGLIVVLLGTGRLVQMRLAARRHRRADRASRGRPSAA